MKHVDHLLDVTLDDTMASTTPAARRAHWAVALAIKEGRLTRQPCEVCGDPISQGHHDDYSKPLDVRWLCPKHHRKFHALAPRRKRQKLPRQITGFGPPLLTKHEAAPMLGLTLQSLDRLITARKISHIKIGHSVRFRIRDLERLLDENTVDRD